MTNGDLAEVFRHESGQVLAVLISWLNDFDLAEDVLQDALLVALERWPKDGTPPNPGGWLMTTARRKALDRLRRQQILAQKQQLLAQESINAMDSLFLGSDHSMLDDQLKLLFTCCHPALNFDARVALTLRTLGGLTTTEIAHMFIVPIPTMAQRLTRAKHKIRAARIPYRVPPLELLPERIPALLAVLYLIFNAGYTVVEGDQLLRRDVCHEAIRLTRALATFVTSAFRPYPEALGLLALMLLQDSRREARTNAGGDLILLEDQDRRLWDHTAIAEGLALVEQALHLHQPGPYQVQAAIAALHAQAPHAGATDWAQIAALYDVLYTMTASPVVALNRAVAYAMADGPQIGLALLDQANLDATLHTYYLYHAARADLLGRVGRIDAARGAYNDALQHCQNAVERRFLERKLAAMGSEC